MYLGSELYSDQERNRSYVYNFSFFTLKLEGNQGISTEHSSPRVLDCTEPPGLDTCSTGRGGPLPPGGSVNHRSLYVGALGGITATALGLAGWVYECGRLPLHPGPQRIAQLNESSMAAAWLPGTFQFTTLHTWSHRALGFRGCGGGERVLKGRKAESHNQAHKTEG